MEKNNSFKEIASCVLKAKKIVLYPHLNMDGDTLGSCVALCRVFRDKGIDSHILIVEDIPDNLKFLDNGYCTNELSIADDADISMLIDSGELKRIKGREEAFQKGKMSICIDHHETSDSFCDLNHINSCAAATGELVFKLLKEMDVTGDKEIANALFAAITTDTGNFQYSNTERLSHEIVAELYDWGLDSVRVSNEIYENYRLERLKLEADAMSRAEIIGGGKVAITCVTQEMLKATGALMNETENIVDNLRSIRGVEVAVLLKEEEEKLIRGSLRSKEWFDVAEFAKCLGGGGHKHASGFTSYKTIEETAEEVKREIENRLNK